MVHQKDEAERLRIGIRGGWLKISEAVAWADQIIAESPEPHPALLDVALASNRTRSEVSQLLESIPGVPNRSAVMRRCLADLLHLVQQQPALARDVAHWLDITASEGGLPPSEFGWEAAELADAFDGYGTVGHAHKRLLSFLRQHASRDC